MFTEHHILCSFYSLYEIRSYCAQTFKKKDHINSENKRFNKSLYVSGLLLSWQQFETSDSLRFPLLNKKDYITEVI